LQKVLGGLLFFDSHCIKRHTINACTSYYTAMAMNLRFKQVIARHHWVYFSSMVSPAGRNNGDSMFGVEVNNIDMIGRKTSSFSHSGLSDSVCCKVNISELCV